MADLRINIWSVDAPMLGGPGAYDLMGDFCGAANWGVPGKVWVELKLFSAVGFEAAVDKTKKELGKTLL